MFHLLLVNIVCSFQALPMRCKYWLLILFLFIFHILISLFLQEAFSFLSSQHSEVACMEEMVTSTRSIRKLHGWVGFESQSFGLKSNSRTTTISSHYEWIKNYENKLKLKGPWLGLTFVPFSLCWKTKSCIWVWSNFTICVT